MNSILLFGMPRETAFTTLFFIFVIPSIIWLWALIDVLRSEFTNSTNKVVWILLIFFLPFLGALLYLIIGRGQKVKA